MFQAIEMPAKEFKRFLPTDYRKRNVRVCAAESVTLLDLNWSGGTRSTYTILTMTGEPVSSTARYSALTPWDNYAEGKSLPIPEGFVVVETGFFCGKQSTARIYINPANMPKFLPRP